MNFENRLSRALCDARTKKDLTQQEVAELAGISPRWYQELEGGRGCPGFHVGLKLMSILEISVAEMLQEDENYASV